MTRLIQFELWKDCSNNCDFCFNKKFGKISSSKLKLERINFAKEFITGPKMKNYSAIGLIGGEFFGGQLSDKEVSEAFHSLIDLLALKLKDGSIEKVWIATALMFEGREELERTLKHFSDCGVLNNVLICTSYDVSGRFKGDGEKLWKDNMKFLKTRYPDIMLHTEIIITQDFVDAVLNNRFDISIFAKEFDTHIDFLEPNCGFSYKSKSEHAKYIKNFYPKRKSFIKFLQKVYTNGSIDLNSFLSSDLRAYSLYTEDNSGYKFFTDRAKKNSDLMCDIPSKVGYIDSDIEMRSDVVKFLEAHNE